MDNDGLFMNVISNVSTTAIKKSSSALKKMEKKNKYTEKKLLNKKRPRDLTNEKKNSSNFEKKESISSNKPHENYTKKNFLDYNNLQVNTKDKNETNNFNEDDKDTDKNIENKNLQKNKFNIDSKNFSNNKILPKGDFNNSKVSKEQGKILELNERQNANEKINNSSIENGLNKEKNINGYEFKENPNDDLIDELNEFYTNQEKENENKPKKLSTKERRHNKEKIKTMQNEIENEIKEINTNAALEEEAKERAKETPIDFNSSVFSLKDFQDLEISLYLKRVLKKENFSIMTKVQKKSIPILLKHRDVVVKSETGSGKTLAYVIPVYDFLINLNIKNKIQRKDGVYTVVFAPTHELCLQIESTFDKLKSCCISAVFGSLMGGQSIETEKARLRKGLNVIITTPGRMLYHLKNTSTLDFSNLKIFVFDEADILLNMGFEKDIKECMRLIFNKFNTSVPDNLCIKVKNNNTDNKKDDLYNDNIEEKICKTVERIEDLDSEYFKKFKIFLISATIDNKIRKMADFLMKGFKSVGFEMKKEQDKNKNKGTNLLKDEDQKIMDIIDEEDNENFTPPANLVQEYSVVFDEFRLIHLLCHIYNNMSKKIIVFVSCCDTVNFLEEFFNNFEFNLEHVISEGEVGVGFNKYKNKEDQSSKNKKNNNSNNNKSNNKNQTNEKNSSNDPDPTKRIQLVKNPILKLHGKMTHEERKKIFKEFNQDKPCNNNNSFINFLYLKIKN